MSTADVPLRLEIALEVPGTPEQVWDAIATANGITAWFIPTDVEERAGGAICFHMGEEADSPGTITGWEPPLRFAFEEPDWASLTGHADAAVTPLATEFLVDAQSGGTCVVRVVSSAFGTGADWESEFFAEMERMWMPFFDRLRLYLTHFPGQRVTPLEVFVDVPSAPAPVFAAMRDALGAEEASPLQILGLNGTVERIDDVQVLVRVADPVPGFVAFVAYPTGEEKCRAAIQGHLFSDDAASFSTEHKDGWQTWLDGAVAATARR